MLTKVGSSHGLKQLSFTVSSNGVFTCTVVTESSAWLNAMNLSSQGLVVHRPAQAQRGEDGRGHHSSGTTVPAAAVSQSRSGPAGQRRTHQTGLWLTSHRWRPIPTERTSSLGDTTTTSTTTSCSLHCLCIGVLWLIYEASTESYKCHCSNVCTYFKPRVMSLDDASRNKILL